MLPIWRQATFAILDTRPVLPGNNNSLGHAAKEPVLNHTHYAFKIFRQFHWVLDVCIEFQI